MSLLPYVGGVGVINWVRSYYNLPFLGTTPYRVGCWGNTQITARGMVYFYYHMQRDSRVAAWLVNAINHHATYASDGTNQSFGIPAAASPVGVKQGWGHCSANDYGSEINSTGIVQSGRFAIAILTQSTHCCYNGAVFNSYVAGVVTTMARTVLPGGKVDLPEAHNPFGHVDAAGAVGSTVDIKGWTIDPDLKNGSIGVRVYEGSTLRWSSSTNLLRSDVNRRYHVSGYHGFEAKFAATNGGHRYCVQFRNYGLGNASPSYCYTVSVNGSPKGHLDSVTALSSPGGVTLSGWAFDPDATSSSIPVSVTRDGSALTTLSADVASPGVDTAYHIAGNHGFAATLSGQPSGKHTYCVTALNIGSSLAPNVALGCAAASVAAAPPPPTVSSSPTPTPTATTPTPAPTSSQVPTDSGSATTGSPTDSSSPSPTDTATQPPTDTASSTPTDTATPSTTTTPAPALSSSSTPASNALPIAGDGGIVNAINNYRLANGLPALTATFSQDSQNCSMENAKAFVVHCSPFENWTNDMPSQDGQLAADSWFSEAPPTNGSWNDYANMMNPNASSMTYGWAYDPDSQTYDVTVDFVESNSS